MVILAADDKKDRLDELACVLDKVFKDDTVLYYSDPLMAGKYAFFNPVDILFSALDMRRMDGFQLAKMVHYANLSAKVFLTGTKEEFEDITMLTDGEEAQQSGINGAFYYPLNKEEIALLKNESQTALKDSVCANCEKTVEDLYEELASSEELKKKLACAALNDTLEEFFKEMGCKADIDDIRAYFRKRIISKAVLSEDQLEDVRGGVSAVQSFKNLILAWAR